MKTTAVRNRLAWLTVAIGLILNFAIVGIWYSERAGGWWWANAAALGVVSAIAVLAILHHVWEHGHKTGYEDGYEGFYS